MRLTHSVVSELRFECSSVVPADVAELRYNVYIQQQAKTYDADHARRRFTDTADGFSQQLVARDSAARLLVAMRLADATVAHRHGQFAQGPLSQLQIPERTAFISRLVRSQSLDARTAVEPFFLASFNHCRESGFTRGLMQTSPKLRSLFERFGWQPVGDAFWCPVAGLQRAFFFDLNNEASLHAVSSPYFEPGSKVFKMNILTSPRDALNARISRKIATAQQAFAERLESYLRSNRPSLEAYQRYLSFQYHMTRGVQRYFLEASASERLRKMRSLRLFLFKFANEEELHYLVAANDLQKLDLDVLPEPFDVTLWHAYFRSVVRDRPFVRLGAAVILENISAGVARPLVQRALSAEFLNASNTKFLVLHQHETLPHGDQIVDALLNAPLTEEDVEDLMLGASQGTVLYLRMVDWALAPDALVCDASDRGRSPDRSEKSLISSFTMDQLEMPELAT